MKFRDYIRQMDDNELARFLCHEGEEGELSGLACRICPYADGEFCVARMSEKEESCVSAMRELLDKDAEDQMLDDFFCR